MERRRLTKVQYRWLGAFLVIVIGIVYYVSWSRITKEIALSENLRAEEKVVAAQSANIDSFFKVFGDAVAIFARTPYLNSLDTQKQLDGFMAQWKGTRIVQGILYTDVDGEVLYTNDISGRDAVGDSVAEREYFKWAVNEAKEGEYRIAKPIVSNVFGKTEGTVVVPVVAPVYRNDEVVGAVVTGVTLPELIESYLGIVQTSSKKEVNLVNQAGKLVYSNTDLEVELHNVLLADHNPFTIDPALGERVDDILFATDTGSMQTDIHVLAYSPLTVGENKWLVISISHVQDELNLTKPILIQYTSIFLFVVFTTVLIFAFSVRGFPVRVEIVDTPEEEKK